ncbi:MAG: hypothetical protein QXE84_04660 [Candidatus Nitrosotenuis sp.]
MEGTFEERAAGLVNRTKKDSDWGMSVLLALSKKLRERTEFLKNYSDYLNPGSFSTYFKPVKKLFEMNNVSVVWKRVYSTFAELDNTDKGRA